jgi:hypothetical protein
MGRTTPPRFFTWVFTTHPTFQGFSWILMMDWIILIIPLFDRRKRATKTSGKKSLAPQIP